MFRRAAVLVMAFHRPVFHLRSNCRQPMVDRARNRWELLRYRQLLPDRVYIVLEVLVAVPIMTSLVLPRLDKFSRR
jgi:hypothetical protein